MAHLYKIHQNLLKYWFTLLHFVMDDPVVGGRRRREKGNKLVAPASTKLCDFISRFPAFLLRPSHFSYQGITETAAANNFGHQIPFTVNKFESYVQYWSSLSIIDDKLPFADHNSIVVCCSSQRLFRLSIKKMGN